MSRDSVRVRTISIFVGYVCQHKAHIMISSLGMYTGMHVRGMYHDQLISVDIQNFASVNS